VERSATPLIDQGSRCEGKFSFRDAVRIDGSFSGEISSKNTLVVGETGEIEASICSARVVVSGSVVGDVRASEQIVLHESARVEGNLSTPSLVMEPGALLNGRIDMGPVPESGALPLLTAIEGGAVGGRSASDEDSSSS
jgi:cytoskeletal protein CcmA (bactofilin family)